VREACIATENPCVTGIYLQGLALLGDLGTLGLDVDGHNLVPADGQGARLEVGLMQEIDLVGKTDADQ